MRVAKLVRRARLTRERAAAGARDNASTASPHAAGSRNDGQWRWLWAEMRPFAHYQAGALIFLLSGVALHAVIPLLLKRLIDDVLPHASRVGLVATASTFAAVYVSSSVLSATGRVINQLGILRLVYRLRMRLLHHVQRLPATFHEQRPIGDLVRRVEEDIALVGDLGSDVLPSLARIALQSGVTIGGMAYLDWRLTCVILPLLPLYTLVSHGYRSPLRRNAQRVRDAAGEQTSLLNEMLAAAVQVQALGAEARLLRRYARLNLRTMRARWEQHTTEVGFTLASMSIVAAGIGLIVGYGGWRVMSGHLTAGGLVAFYSYLGLIFAPLMTATELYARLNRVRASVTRLIEIERAPRVIRDTPRAASLAGCPQRVNCTAVVFGYRAGEPALAGVDFSACAGEWVALAGPSGCGKSSLLKLIPRFYDVERGTVEIDGRDVRGLQLRSLRRAISFVPQDPVLFQGTLLENLRHGCPAARRDDVDRVLWMACLTDVISRLPDGLETPLGRGASGLSGGERQRLAVARAILQDRPIVILDEAMSALDAGTEQELLRRLVPWCRGRIVIVVSHRPLAWRRADRVVTLDRGRLAASDARAANE